MTGMLSIVLEFELGIGTKGGIIPFIGGEEHREVELQIQVLARAGHSRTGELGIYSPRSRTWRWKRNRHACWWGCRNPAWWMAFNSFSLSLFIADCASADVQSLPPGGRRHLSRNHIMDWWTISLLDANVVSVLKSTTSVKVEPRELSIDIMVPYKNTENTLTDSKSIRDEILKMSPVALFHAQTRPTHRSNHWFRTGNRFRFWRWCWCW